MTLEASDLIKILHQQTSLITELRGLVNQQLQALKQDELDMITSITSQQEYIGRQIADLEEQRRLIISEYSRTIGFDIKNFSELQQYTTSSDWSEIQSLRDKILTASQEIKRDNELNALLLKQGLKYAEKMLHVLNPNKKYIYGKSGDLNRGVSQGIVDTNV
jgi:flagellar biosynthesis/type III secretory pathway chaperone